MMEALQRIAIAEKLGAKRYLYPEGGTIISLHDLNARDGLAVVENAEGFWPGADFIGSEIPNYPHDLNACAQMEAALEDYHWDLYGHYLQGELGVDELFTYTSDTDGDRYAEQKYAIVYRLVTATAAQRCKAFLRTIERWNIPLKNHPLFPVNSAAAAGQPTGGNCGASPASVPATSQPTPTRESTSSQ